MRADRVEQTSVGQERGSDWLDRLADWISGNRFMPVPPPQRNFVGDGDYLSIGCEFLRHFARLGGARPDHRVLEIGCGIGRMAVPLTQYLDPETGSYHGVDVVRDGIVWCDNEISSRYPAFRFHHLDYANALYNPDGHIRVSDERLPFAPGSFDFIIMTSVVTHLESADVAAYMHEAARLMKPNGRLFMTAFLLDAESRAGIAAGRARPSFPLDAPGPQVPADPDQPLAAVAYDDEAFLGLAGDAGLALVLPTLRGHWAGGASDHYQDICLLSPASGRSA